MLDFTSLDQKPVIEFVWSNNKHHMKYKISGISAGYRTASGSDPIGEVVQRFQQF